MVTSEIPINYYPSILQLMDEKKKNLTTKTNLANESIGNLVV